MGEAYGWLTSFWLVWMVILFVGIVVWVYWPGRKKTMDAHGRIPLDDGPEDKGKQER